ncbi:MAG TPA: hypothetical protein VF498_09745 [Anaerolineales bacterium]
MDIGRILGRAWEIIWKHKILWIFGILAGCTNLSYNSSNFRYTLNNQNLPSQWQPQFSQGNIGTFILVAIGVILIALVIAAIAIFLGTIGHIGIIRGTQQAEQGAATLTFGEIFSGSLPYFWRVFLLDLLVGLAVALASLLLILSIFLSPLVCLIGIFALFIGGFVSLANNAIVLENLGIRQGLQRAWNLIRTDLANVIVLALILELALGLIVGVILALPFLLIAVPVLGGLVYGLASSSNTTVIGSILLGGLCVVIYLPILIVISGILRSYIESAWTLTYLRLMNRPAAVEIQPTAMV